jgi:hypothetical protein
VGKNQMTNPGNATTLSSDATHALDKKMVGGRRAITSDSISRRKENERKGRGSKGGEGGGEDGGGSSKNARVSEHGVDDFRLVVDADAHHLLDDGDLA